LTLAEYEKEDKPNKTIIWITPSTGVFINEYSGEKEYMFADKVILLLMK